MSAVPPRRPKLSKGPPKLKANNACLAIMSLNRQTSPLLRLPMELRYMIYEHALDIGDAHVSIYHADFLNWDRMNLCYASRQIWADISREYYDLKLHILREKPPVFRSMGALERTLGKYTPLQKNFLIKIYVTKEAFLGLSEGLDERSLLLQLKSLDWITGLDVGSGSNSDRVAQFRVWLTRNFGRETGLGTYSEQEAVGRFSEVE